MSDSNNTIAEDSRKSHLQSEGNVHTFSSYDILLFRREDKSAD